MKSIQNQYRDLKEGRMSQANFMRNLRMTMPQFVTNVTSFNDAVRILKNKSILSESLDNFDEAVVLSKKEFEPNTKSDVPAEDEMGDNELDAILQGIEAEKVGEEEVKAQWDIAEDHSGNPNDKYVVKKSDTGWCVWEGDVKVNEFETEEEAKKFADEKNAAQELNEAKAKKAELHQNQIHPQELRMGIKVELEHTDELDKAKKIALDHLAENPFYYTALKLSGIESPSAPKVKQPEEKKTKKTKETIQLVDLVNGMQKVKMPKKDEKKKIKESVDERMRFQDLPADPEKYKIVKDSKGYIIKATNADGVEFQKGDVAKTYDGEEIKIAKFEESQGKVKAIYNKGMFFTGIDIDGLEAGKPEFRPGVNMGGSFEKMKSSLEEIIRETISEYFDGRDNLDAKNETLTPEEQKVVNDILETLQEGIFDKGKLVSYLKKGLVTVAVIGALLGSTQLDFNQKKDIVDTVKIEKTVDQDIKDVADARLAIDYYNMYKAKVDKAAENDFELQQVTKEINRMVKDNETNNVTLLKSFGKNYKLEIEKLIKVN